MRRPRLLVVGAIGRADILAMFDGLRDDADLTFIEYFHNEGTPPDPDLYRKYGTLRFWSDFPNAEAMLRDVRPSRVVSFYLASLTQVATRVVARRLGLPVLHLEHGYRLRYDEAVDDRLMRAHARRWAQPRHLARQFPQNLETHAFFWRSLPAVRGAGARRLAAFGAEVYTRGMSPPLLRRYASIRRADRYISFSPECFEFHRVQDLVPDKAPERVRYIGIPQFEDYATVRTGAVDPRRVVLIDHAFHTAGLFGWRLEHRAPWVASIMALMDELGLQLEVKTHPGDRSNAWQSYAATGRVRILNAQDLVKTMSTTGIVLGNLSTMQIPLAALPHTALLTLEIHPESGHFPSRAFVESGVGQAVFSFAELRAALVSIERLRESQVPVKGRFIEQFMYKFDGRSRSRLRDALLEDCDIAGDAD